MVVLVNGCGHEVMTVHITDCAKQGNNKISSSVVRYGMKYNKVLLMPLDGTWQVPHKDTGITNERGRNQHTAPDYGGLHDAQLCV